MRYKMIHYEKNPQRIQQNSFDIVRLHLEPQLNYLSELEQQIAIRLIYACGDSSIIHDLYFSKGAAQAGLESLIKQKPILCDVNLVIAALNKTHLIQPPLCFINEPQIIKQAKEKNHTRSMVAVEYWQDYIEQSIVLIGNAPTALFRLMELIEKNKIKKPALIIATPVGYTGAAESKQYLCDHYQNLGVECILLLGTHGSSILAATAMNAVLSYYHGVKF